MTARALFVFACFDYKAQFFDLVQFKVLVGQNKTVTVNCQTDGKDGAGLCFMVNSVRECRDGF